MYPLNDNDLDRLSREAAEQYDVDQNTSGWDALDNRLNKELPLKDEKERRRFLFWLFFIVLLAGGGLLWTMTSKTNNAVQVTGTNTVPSANENKNTNDAGTLPSPNPGTTQEVTTAPTSSPSSSVTTPAPVSGQTGATEPAAPVVASSAKKNSPSISPVSTDEIAADKLLSDKANRKNITATTNKKNKKSKRLTGKEKAPSGEVDDYMVPIGHISDWDNASAHPLKASLVSGVDLESNMGAIKAPPFPVAATDSADGKKTPPKKKDNKGKGFEIGLVTGPDMSNVKFTDMDKLGYNVGLQIGYRFSDRWSVNTGLLYTKKNYTAQGEDWTKAGSWWQNRELISVQGYCQMFEIPLNVRYNLSVNNKQRWFVSTGASSYIMTGEYYNYDYTYVGSSDRRQWSAERDSTSKYLFSIVNLSAGFERSLSKRFSIQVEPYFKFPLKGLGYGKLDLNSYGIYFSAKYKLGK